MKDLLETKNVIILDDDTASNVDILFKVIDIHKNKIEDTEKLIHSEIRNKHPELVKKDFTYDGKSKKIIIH